MKPIELTEDFLLSIRKPARYIGEEHNIIKKEWDKTDVKFCLCYPDLYEIGMSNLGVKILYHILNRHDGVLCERSFTPWLDMEEAMIKNNIPLFSLESKVPLSEFDILGFSFSKIFLICLSDRPNRTRSFRKRAFFISNMPNSKNLLSRPNFLK